MHFISVYTLKSHRFTSGKISMPDYTRGLAVRTELLDLHVVYSSYRWADVYPVAVGYLTPGVSGDKAGWSHAHSAGREMTTWFEPSFSLGTISTFPRCFSTILLATVNPNPIPTFRVV